jgi:hypothetical protein
VETSLTEIGWQKGEHLNLFIGGAVDPWIILPQEKARYEEQFRALQPVNGIITGEQAKGFLLQSRLTPQILGHIWYDIDVERVCVLSTVTKLK